MARPEAGAVHFHQDVPSAETGSPGSTVAVIAVPRATGLVPVRTSALANWSFAGRTTTPTVSEGRCSPVVLTSTARISCNQAGALLHTVLNGDWLVVAT